VFVVPLARNRMQRGLVAAPKELATADRMSDDELSRGQPKGNTFHFSAASTVEPDVNRVPLAIEQPRIREGSRRTGREARMLVPPIGAQGLNDGIARAADSRPPISWGLGDGRRAEDLSSPQVPRVNDSVRRADVLTGTFVIDWRNRLAGERFPVRCKACARPPASIGSNRPLSSPFWHARGPGAVWLPEPADYFRSYGNTQPAGLDEHSHR